MPQNVPKSQRIADGWSQDPPAALGGCLRVAPNPDAAPGGTPRLFPTLGLPKFGNFLLKVPLGIGTGNSRLDWRRFNQIWAPGGVPSAPKSCLGSKVLASLKKPKFNPKGAFSMPEFWDGIQTGVAAKQTRGFVGRIPQFFNLLFWKIPAPCPTPENPTSLPQKNPNLVLKAAFRPLEFNQFQEFLT